MKNRVHNTTKFIIILIIAILLSGCGPSADEFSATKTKIAANIYSTQTAAVPTATNTTRPTPTNTHTSTPNRTATAAFRATSTAQSMANLIQQLYEDGFLQSTRGEYIQQDDFEMSLAQINRTEFGNTGIYLSDFVLRSDIAWETARKGANTYYSGCGFFFGFPNEKDRYHLVMLTLSGNIRFQRWTEGSYLFNLASNYFGKIDYMKGDAELIITVEDDTIQAFINGERIFVRPDQYKWEGDLGFAINSGTNAGFGTRCTFLNTEIWSLEP